MLNRLVVIARSRLIKPLRLLLPKHEQLSDVDWKLMEESNWILRDDVMMIGYVCDLSACFCQRRSHELFCMRYYVA